MNYNFNIIKGLEDDYEFGDTISIVGSTKFKSRFLELSKELELIGANVLHTHLFSHTDGYELNDEQVRTAHSNGISRIQNSEKLILISPDFRLGENTKEEIIFATNMIIDDEDLEKRIPIKLAPIKIGVHNGIFHADDILSIAMILSYLNDKFECSNLNIAFGHIIPKFDVQIIRTRDQNILDTCDWVVDVGFRDLIDEQNLKFNFDHHQKDSGYYSNGIKMAACGKLANYLYSKDPEFLKYLRENLLYAVEAQDNGQNITEFGKYSNPISFIRLMNNNWDDADPYEFFEDAILMTYTIFNRLKDKYYSDVAAKETMDQYIGSYIDSLQDDNNHRHILINYRYYVPWQEQVIKFNNEEAIVNDKIDDERIFVIIFPSLDGGYTCQVVPKELNSFESFVSFPKEWRGLQNKALEKASGIEGAKFCHAAGFLSSWETIEGAIKAAEAAIK